MFSSFLSVQPAVKSSVNNDQNREILKKNPLVAFVPEGAKTKDPENPVTEPVSCDDEFPNFEKEMIHGDEGIVKRVFKDVNWKPNNSIVGGLILLTK